MARTKPQSKTRATDADIVDIARRLDKLNTKIVHLVNEILTSGHPHAEKIGRYINEDLNIPVPAFFPVEIHHLLEHPDKWGRNAKDTDLVRKKRPRKK